MTQERFSKTKQGLDKFVLLSKGAMLMMHDATTMRKKRKRTNNFLLGENPGLLQTTPLTRDCALAIHPLTQEGGKKFDYRFFMLPVDLLDTTNKTPK